MLCTSGRLDTGHSLRTLVEELLGSLPEVDWSAARRVLAASPLSAAAYAKRHLGDEFLPALIRATATAEQPESIRLLAGLPFRALITTSYGDALERVADPLPACTPHDLYFNGHERHVLKLLGRPQEPETLIWTAQDVAAQLADPERRAVVQELYSDCRFLLLGFSTADPDFRLVLEHVVSAAGSHSGPHLAVVDEISDMEREELDAVYGIDVMVESDVVHAIRDLYAAMGKRSRAKTAVLPEFSATIEDCLARLEDDPGCQSALLELEQVEVALRRTGDHETLVDLYIGRVGIEPDAGERAELLIEVARLLEREMDDAERAFRALVASYTHAPRRAAWAELERLAGATGLWDELLQALNDSLDDLMCSERIDTLLHMAHLYDRELGHCDYALSCLDMALELDPMREHIQTRRLELLRRHERWDELVEALERQALVADSPVVRSDRLVELADLYESRLDDPVQALAYYRQALDCDPWSPDARLPYEALLRRRGNYTELVWSLEQRLHQAPLEEQVAIRKEIAELCDQKLDDVTRATRHYEDLRADAPADLGVLKALARLYEQQGCLKEQLGVLAAELGVVEDNAQRAEICLQMATQWKKLGSEAQVQECLEWVLAYGGRYDEVFETLAQMYRAQGHWQAAIDVYCRHAQSATPAERAQRYYQVAHIYETELDDASSAIDFYVKATGEGADHAESLAALARLYEQREMFEDMLEVLERQVMHTELARRAEMFHRAGDIALTHLGDDVAAESYFERGLVVDAGHVPSMRGLVAVYKRRDELARAAALMDRAIAVARPDEAAELLVEAGQIREALHERDKAAARYREALRAEPEHLQAASRLSELLWATGSFDELVPLLRMLTDKQPEHPRHVDRLLRLGRAEAAQGNADRADQAFAAARSLSSGDREILAAYAAFLGEQGEWSRARAHLRTIAEDHEASLPAAEYLELHYQLARCAHALSDMDEAREHLHKALAVDPNHKQSLLLSLEFDDVEPQTVIATKTHLLQTAAGDADKAALLSDIGEVYFKQLGDLSKALESLRRALDYQPKNHLILHQCLDVLMAQEDWEQSVAVLAELIASETEPAVRAKYRFTAAMLLIDKLDDKGVARHVLRAALDDDPSLTRAAAAYEDILRDSQDWQALAEHYCAAIQHLGPKADDGNNPERLRLWSGLGELCATRLDDRDGALCAYEVAADLDPDNVAYLEALADLYTQAGPEYADKAIAVHQRLLRMNKSCLSHYVTLGDLYRQAGRDDEAALCDAAHAFLGPRAASDLPEANIELPLELDGPVLSPAMWARVRHPEQDRRLSALFALVSPVLAAVHARTPAQLGLDDMEQVAAGDRRDFAAILRQVARILAIAAPEAYLCSDRVPPVQVVHSAASKGSQPVFVLNQDFMTSGSERELAFHLARHVATLHPELAIGHFVSSPKQLAQIIDAAMALSAKSDGTEVTSSTAVTHTAATLAGCLSPAALDQVIAIGRELRAAGMRTEDAAATWLRAADYTATRAALAITGDLATCVQRIAHEPRRTVQWSQADRILDLVWSSATEDLFAVHRHLGRWDAADPGEPGARSPSSEMRAVQPRQPARAAV